MNRVRHDCVRLQMKKADSFCACRSVGYPVKIELGSFMTMTALFIMILPEKEMGLRNTNAVYPVPVQSIFFM